MDTKATLPHGSTMKKPLVASDNITAASSGGKRAPLSSPSQQARSPVSPGSSPVVLAKKAVWLKCTCIVGSNIRADMDVEDWDGEHKDMLYLTFRNNCCRHLVFLENPM